MEKVLVEPFRRAGLPGGMRPSRRIDAGKFVNILNYHHFIQAPVFVLVRHRGTGSDLLVGVVPDPCRKDTVRCTLPSHAHVDLADFEIRGLLVDDGDTITFMEVETPDISERAFTARLRGKALQYRTRSAVRESCEEVRAIVTVNGLTATGFLEEFHPGAMRIRISGDVGEIAAKLTPKTFATLALLRDSRKVYGGNARLVRVEKGEGVVVLAPVHTPAVRYMNRRYRNVRVTPDPAPRLLMTHPLTGRRIFYDIADMTNTGLSIVERDDLNTLLPGMVIDDARIIFPGELEIPCPIRVVYARRCGGRKMRLGCSITDMSPADYARLFNLVTRADDPHSVATSMVSMDALWDFFFRSGFIYPDKYMCISGYKDEFKRSYETLYHRGRDVFSSLTYQENNTIYGHVSIVRAYPFTWMVHHLAAVPMKRKRTGLFVLQQILNFLDGFHRMPSVKMRYLIFYYRPENKFPNFFFGGVHGIIGNADRCSIDHFAYLTLRIDGKTAGLPGGWELRPCSALDIAALHDAYRMHSNGIMTEVFCLEQEGDDLWKAYERLGLRRECRSYVLIHGGVRKAFFIVDTSDRGMNLSDLLNGIKIIVAGTDPPSLPWEILRRCVETLGVRYGTPEVVVQVFPVSYMDASGVGYKKRYCLWALRARYLDPHLDDIKNMTSFSRLKYLRSLLKTMLGSRQ